MQTVIASRFRTDVLEREASSIVGISPDGTIGWANRAWFDFADRNGGAHAAIHVGDNYFAAISGDVRAPFEAAVVRCLATNDPVEQEYECSSATELRAFRLRMLPIDGRALVFVHTRLVARSHDRRAEPPDEALYRDARGLIAQCSNCRRTLSPKDGSWHWVPAWVASMPARVTHVLCAVCREFYWPNLRRRD